MPSWLISKVAYPPVISVLLPQKYNFSSSLSCGSIDTDIVDRTPVGPSIDAESMLSVEEQKVEILDS